MTIKENDPLYLEVCKENPNVKKVEKLINEKKDFDINAQIGKTGHTLLERAALHNEKLKTVKLLLKKGASTRARKKGTWIPLHSAIFNRYDSLKMTKALIKAMKKEGKEGVDLDIPGTGGWTALDHAIDKIEKSTHIAFALIHAGAKTNKKVKL